MAALVARASLHVITPEEREAQIRSFVYGNAVLSNPMVTRAMVDAAADAMRGPIAFARGETVDVEAVLAPKRPKPGGIWRVR
jgi:hypothetical protein